MVDAQLQVNVDGVWASFCNRTFRDPDEAFYWFSQCESTFETRLVFSTSTKWLSGKTTEERAWEHVSKSKRSR